MIIGQAYNVRLCLAVDTTEYKRAFLMERLSVIRLIKI